jgi:hypothetical protein
LLAGKSGISQIERWDPNKYELTTTIAGEIKGACSRAGNCAAPFGFAFLTCFLAQTLTPPAG